MNTFFLYLKYAYYHLKHYWLRHNRQGHHIHSPFMFNMILHLMQCKKQKHFFKQNKTLAMPLSYQKRLLAIKDYLHQHHIVLTTLPDDSKATYQLYYKTPAQKMIAKNMDNNLLIDGLYFWIEIYYPLMRHKALYKI